MDIKGQYLVFFSATNSTRAVVREIGKETGLATFAEYNITSPREDLKVNIELEKTDLLIVGVPSFSGRVPEIALEQINRFKGNNTPAIIVCTYGNRDYDDTLLELRDTIESNGFKAIAAGAFVARHSIFPDVASTRPDDKDKDDLGEFCKQALELINNIANTREIPEIKVKGNHPYKSTGKIPLRPTGNSKCNNCGTCAHLCPTGAIPEDNPRKTDKSKCIACARCIAVCPEKARAFRGLLYKLARSQFVKKHQAPQANTTSFVDI